MNRRTFLQGLYGRPDNAQQRSLTTGLEPFVPTSEQPWDYTRAAHLLRRTVVGPTDAEIRRAVDEGLDRTLERLFTPHELPLGITASWAGVNPRIRVPDTLTDDEWLEWRRQNVEKCNQLTRWWLGHMATSSMSIQETMTRFWHRHFPNDQRAVQWAEIMRLQLDSMRHNALGNFKDIVWFMTCDLAMLIYLDGWANCKIGSWVNINENYSRELLELFTMGIYDWDGKPNYSQTDVSEGARALTGLTAQETKADPDVWERFSVYKPAHHDDGMKTYLGRTGAWTPYDLIELIFTERSVQTSRFICTKIYRTFVYDQPDLPLIDGLATVLREHEWEIAPVIEHLLRSAHFFDPENIGALVKSHVELHTGLIRTLQLQNVPDFMFPADTPSNNNLYDRLLALQEVPLYPNNVQGWLTGHNWVSSSVLPARMKFGIDVALGAINAYPNGQIFRYDPIAFARSFPDADSFDSLFASICALMLSSPLSKEEHDMLYETFLDSGVPYEWSLDDPAQKPGPRIRKLLAAIATLPGFQLS